MAVFENSRYLKTRMVSRGMWDNLFFALRRRFKFNEELYTYHEWVEGDTLDGVAFRYYEDTNLRWAILDANPKYKTEFGIKNGDIINIPDYENIVEVLKID